MNDIYRNSLESKLYLYLTHFTFTSNRVSLCLIFYIINNSVLDHSKSIFSCSIQINLVVLTDVLFT
jgi:hypothetical protein